MEGQLLWSLREQGGNLILNLTQAPHIYSTLLHVRCTHSLRPLPLHVQAITHMDCFGTMAPIFHFSLTFMFIVICLICVGCCE